MITGDRPVTAVETIRASGVRPSSAALVSLMTMTAAAPSLSGQALPAVTRPSGRNTGFSAEMPSRVVPARGRAALAPTRPPRGVAGGGAGGAGGARGGRPPPPAGVFVCAPRGEVLAADGELVHVLP